jgi:hypothetical protein
MSQSTEPRSFGEADQAREFPNGRAAILKINMSGEPVSSKRARDGSTRSSPTWRGR